jgi:5-methylthioadenosine/S-adenosylhomocysteine deaminase
MEFVDILLINGVIVTQDDARTIYSDGALAVKNDRIHAIGPTETITAQFSAAETIDLQGDALFPGLINTHTHLFQTAVKGLGEDMPVQEWVEAVTAPTAAHLGPEEAYLFGLNGCLEHIHCGVTTLVDMSYPVSSMAVHEHYIASILDSGLRGRYSSAIADFGDLGLPPEILKPIDTFLIEEGSIIAESRYA